MTPWPEATIRRQTHFWTRLEFDSFFEGGKVSVANSDDQSPPRYYHGTRADLKPGDLVEAGRLSNYGDRFKSNYVYLTATLEAATWGAELAVGEGRGRIYIVEPTGEISDDPNLTDKKFPGNPTKSYRTREPLRVVGEVTDWTGHPPEKIQEMKDLIRGLNPIED
jgi:Rifampin ADP-ribosyl transferase